uniref:Cruzioseptin-14 n=1 Tax=Cruziohyla calcarifer TaxID=318249 RepID=CZS14_CRUCA|nr:RecName: Full=Cruzioseptin-14; Short=CZS-14 [Cruziohyla calcarifer]
GFLDIVLHVGLAAGKAALNAVNEAVNQ